MRHFEIEHDTTRDDWYLIVDGERVAEMPRTSTDRIALPDIKEAIGGVKREGHDCGLDHVSRGSLDACDRCLRLLADGKSHSVGQMHAVMLAGSRMKASWMTRLIKAMEDDGHVFRECQDGDPRRRTIGAMTAAMTVATRRGPMSLAESTATRPVPGRERPVSQAEVAAVARREVRAVLADGKYHRVDEIMEAIANPHRKAEADRRFIHDMAKHGELREKRNMTGPAMGRRAITWFALPTVTDVKAAPTKRTVAVADQLDELGVPLESTKRNAAKVLRAGAVPASDTTILAALRYRRERAKPLPVAPERKPVAILGDDEDF